MKILVTGAAGFIGSNLCLSLIQGGYQVLGVDCFSDYYPASIKRHNADRLSTAGVEMKEFDLATNAFSSPLVEVDGVVHCAGQPGISSSTPWEDYERNNILATHRLLNAVTSSKTLKSFINISSSSVYGIFATEDEELAPKPASWYGETKLAAEQEVMGTYRNSGFPACSLRLFSVIGERERPDKLFPKLIRSIACDETFPLYDGSLEHRRSFTYVRDVCDAILVVLEQWSKAEGEVFNIGSDHSFSTSEAIEIVEDIMGKKVRTTTLPSRPGDQKATHANIEKISSTLDWRPRTSLRQALTNTVNWYLDEIHEKVEWK